MKINLVVFAILCLSFEALSMEENNEENTWGSWISKQYTEKRRYLESRTDPCLQDKMICAVHDDVENRKTRELYDRITADFGACEIESDIQAFSKRMNIAIFKAHELCNQQTTNYMQNIEQITRFLDANARILPDFLIQDLISKRDELITEQENKLQALKNIK
jgi:hypothetical protein